MLNSEKEITSNLLSFLDKKRHVDDVIKHLDIKPERTLALLLVLEVMREVEQLPGKFYVKLKSKA